MQLLQRRPCLRAPAARRYLASAALVSGALLAGACGSSHPAAAGSARASGSPVPASPALTSTAPARTAPTPGGTMAASGTCAQRAAHAFVQITQVQAAARGALTVTGHPAKLICGGPDDFHFNPATSTETSHVVPGASIVVFPIATMGPKPIQPGQLASYLATDSDTRIFLITGPLTAVTGLQEQFHP